MASPPVLDSLSPVICATKLEVKGSAAPESTVRVNDGSVSLSGRADGLGRFNILIPISSNGFHELHVVVLDETK